MEEIKEQLLDDTFTTSLTGTSRDYAESSSNTAFAFVLALVLIYLILAAQFESFIDPLDHYVHGATGDCRCVPCSAVFSGKP